jgi:hypothetical protein
MTFHTFTFSLLTFDLSFLAPAPPNPDTQMYNLLASPLPGVHGVRRAWTEGGLLPVILYVPS